MAQTVRARISKIGNSQGVWLPKGLLEQAGIGDEVELEVRAGQITLRRVGSSRRGWDEAFRRMAEAGDDQLLDDPIPATRWEADDW